MPVSSSLVPWKQVGRGRQHVFGGRGSQRPIECPDPSAPALRWCGLAAEEHTSALATSCGCCIKHAGHGRCCNGAALSSFFFLSS